MGYLTRPPAEQTTLTLLALLKYYREVRSLPHEPLHRGARYLIVDEAPFQEHYPELWLSKHLFRVSGHEVLALSVALWSNCCSPVCGLASRCANKGLLPGVSWSTLRC